MMSVLCNRYLILYLLPLKICCIWPPFYNINLSQNETFEISESLEHDDVSDIYDDTEMIKNNELNAKENAEKYYRIHQMAMKRDKKELDILKNKSRNKRIKEYNFDKDESIPWSGGFVDKNGNFIQPDNQNVYYLNEMAKSLIDEKIQKKREEKILDVQNLTRNEPKNYDYLNFKAQYDEGIKNAKYSSDTLNFTDIKEDESVKEAIDTIIDFKKLPKNCTKEEMKGIGLGAVECLWIDLKNPKSQNTKWRIVEKFFRLVMIWFCVYLIIATAFWCQKGWCCCCCRCKFCKPHERIDEAKKFFMDNPSGTYHQDDGEIITYQPTEYEKHAENKLKEALMSII